MRYGKWNIVFEGEYGTTPDLLDGLFYTNDEQIEIAGYIPDDIDIENLSKWSVAEITLEEFQQILFAKSPEAQIVDGLVFLPKQAILGDFNI